MQSRLRVGPNMYPARFEYLRASNLAEAIDLVGAHPGAKFLAGGHSLIPMMKLRLAGAPVLIDIGRLPELKGVELDGDTLRVGALTTHSELASSEMVRSACSLLAEAASQIADPAVRNRGTIGGNLAHSDPGSDLPAVVQVVNARLVVTGPSESREVEATDFFLDLMMSDLKEDEILTAIEIPVSAGSSGSCYLKFEHPASGYAVCGAAAQVELAEDGNCRAASLGFNGVASTPVRIGSIERALSGSFLGDDEIDRAVDDTLSFADPMGDMYASAPYRVHLAHVYGKRALKKARDRARG